MEIDGLGDVSILIPQQNEGIAEKVRYLIEHIQSMGFECSVRNKSIVLVYEHLGICQLMFSIKNEQVVLHLEKMKTSDYELIQQKVPYFNEYWSEYFDEYVVNIEQDVDVVLHNLNTLLEVFFKDVTVNFRINEMTFKDYRSFKKEQIVFNEKLTVLIGKNSSGKTSVLDAAAVALGAFLSGIDEPTDSKTITKEDVRFSSKEREGVKIISNHSPTSISFNTDFISNRITWSRTRNSLNSTKLTTKDSNKVVNLVRYLVNEIRNNEDREITLPVFSYHGTGRVANFTKDMKLLEKTENISRFVGYKDCLKPASNYKFFIAWYSKMQYRAFTLNRRIPTLDAVTHCLEKALISITMDEDFTVERVLYLEGALHLQYSNGELMPISFLSDGYQDIIGIISDIAYRMAILNPHLGKHVLEETPGVILIDEIDVHLHPRWQQKILPLLKMLFPKVQFITTTHSPIIVSTTEKNEAVEIEQIDNNVKQFNVIGEPKEWYISDILQNVFDLKQDVLNRQRLLDTQDKLELFSEWVKDYLRDHRTHSLRSIEALYNELIELLPQNSPQIRAVQNLMGLLDQRDEAAK